MTQLLSGGWEAKIASPHEAYERHKQNLIKWNRKPATVDSASVKLNEALCLAALASQRSPKTLILPDRKIYKMDRRGFLRRAGQTAAVAAAASTLPYAGAQALFISDIDIVRDFGADPTGATEIGGTTGALGLAVARAAAQGGGTIRIPHGTFLWNNTAYNSSTGINFGGVEIRGAGWDENVNGSSTGSPTFVHPSSPQNTTHGTYIKRTSASQVPLVCTADAYGSLGVIVRDLFFWEAQPGPIEAAGIGYGTYTPIKYPPVILIAGSNGTIQSGGNYTIQASSTGAQGGGGYLENLMFWNSYNGVQLGTFNNGSTIGAYCGRVSLNRIRGNPLLFGIIIAAADDTIRIHDVHFWPFFSYSNSSTNAAVYCQTNAFGIYSCRNDSPQCEDIFAFGYNAPMYLDNTGNGGGTTNGVFSNYTSDHCVRGLVINGGQPSVMQCGFTNLDIGTDGLSNALQTTGILITGNTYNSSNVSYGNNYFTNVQIASINGSAIEVDAGSPNATTGKWAFVNCGLGYTSGFYMAFAGTGHTIVFGGMLVSFPSTLTGGGGTVLTSHVN